MNLDRLESLPETIESSEVGSLVREYFATVSVPLKPSDVEIIEILCDKQWHTYETPSGNNKLFLSDWIKSHWHEDNEFYECVLGICYSFALSTELYRLALSCYKGESLDEYQRYLEKSDGDFIDPYWSLK